MSTNFSMILKNIFFSLTAQWETEKNEVKMTTSIEAEKRFKQSIDRRIRQLEAMACKYAPLEKAILRMTKALEKENKILIFGNGGSATQSSHLAAELVNKFYVYRKPLAAIALTADMANLTSIANDSDYTNIFARQVDALGNSGDVAIGISTSGTSANVLRGLQKAKDKNLVTIALCGQNTTPLTELGVDVVLDVPETDTPIIQEIHLLMLHTMADALEKAFTEKN